MNNINVIKEKVFRKNIVSITIDDFNSKIFNRKMGNIDINYEANDKTNAYINVHDIIGKAKREGYQHLTVKIPTDDKKTVNTFLSQGFLIADTLITWMFKYGKCQLPAILHNVQLDECTSIDLANLKKIARTSFKIDRFHSDPSLSDELCDQYYEKWIENSYNGLTDKVIVARINNEAVGFTTCSLGDAKGYSHLVLSAVSGKHRGLGIYTSMIHEGVSWYLHTRANTSRGLLVGTQIDNIAVQKSWNKLGFIPFNSSYVLQTII